MDWIQQLGSVSEWPNAAISALALSIAVLLGLLGHLIIFKVLFRLVARPDTSLQQALVRRWRQPAKMLLPLLVALLVLSSIKTFGAGPGDVLGAWKTEGTNSRLELFRCGEKFCGKIISPKGPEDIDSRYGSVGKAEVDSKNPDPALRNRPIIGMEIMKGFTAKGDNQWGNGICYNPESGKSYKCKMHMVSPDRLELRGYIWIPFFGRTFVLTR